MSIQSARAVLRLLVSISLASGCGGCGSTPREPATTGVERAEEASATDELAPSAPAAAASCEVMVHCPAGERSAGATGATHAEACASAAASAGLGEPGCDPRVVDGVPPGFLVSPAGEAPTPSTRLDEPVTCELVIRETTGAPAHASGTGSSDEEAFASAIRSACEAMGRTECTDEDGYRARVTGRRSSFRFDSTGSASVVTVELDLAATRPIEGRGSSLVSRLDACQQAYREACGEEGCDEGRRLDVLEGVRVWPLSAEYRSILR